MVFYDLFWLNNGFIGVRAGSGLRMSILDERCPIAGSNPSRRPES